MSNGTIQRPRKSAGGWRKVLSTCALAVGSLCAIEAQAATFTCNNSTDFSNALTSCAQGDTIILTAGNTFTAPGGGFVLPYKSTTASYITIQSSALANLPEGRRVSSTDESHMPKIYAANGGASNSCIITATGGANGPHHYKLLGLALIASADNADTTALLRLGDASSAQNALAKVPHNIIVDRCILRPNTPATQVARRGIQLDSASTDIINCRISDFKTVTTSGNDSQGIAGWNGPGPYNITNNYLTAASENIMFGGSTPQITNQNPSNIVIRKNHFTKPWDDWDTGSWMVKNLFELKAGVKVFLEGNIFEHSWGTLQEGKGLSFKTVRQSGQGASWTDTKDIMVVNNLIRKVGIGVSIAGSTQGSGSDPDPLYGTPWNLTFQNNLFERVVKTDINSPDLFIRLPGNPGELSLIGNNSQNVVFNHNTGFADNRIMDVIGGNMPGWVWTNNINHKGTYDFKSSFTGAEGTFDNCFVGPPAIVFQKNVVMGSTSSTFLPTYHGGWSPTSLAFPASWTGVLVNQAAPGLNFAGFQVPDASSYDNAGTDGTDVGCNVADVMASVSGTISGNPTLKGYDGFNYSVAAGLNTQTGGVEWLQAQVPPNYPVSTAWAAVSGQTNPALAANSLSYTDSAGNKLLTGGNMVAPAANSRSTRDFPATLVTAGQTYWVSCRIKQTAGTFPTNHAGFSLFSSPAGANNEIFIGKPGGQTNWGIYHQPSNSTATKSGSVDYDVFLVCKMVFTGTQVTISLWVDPIMDEASLGTAHAQLLNKAHTTNIASMRVSTGANSTNYQFDEFRISTTFADIAPKQ